LAAVSEPGLNRRIVGLAVPALGALAAEPLYVLVDTAVVGRLGAHALASLAVAGGLLTYTVWLFNFLAYGTTGRAARLFGAGRRDEAVAVGAQATWLALVIGLALTALLEVLAEPIVRLVAGPDPTTRAEAVSWLRIAALGAPAILISLAGQGWMRGVQDVRRPLVYLIAANVASAVASPVLVYGLDMGLEGSAVANVLAQTVAAGLFVRHLLLEGSLGRPQPRELVAQLRVGRDLLVRTLMLQVAFLSATAVASRFGADRAAAHQIALQLWIFVALILDSLAIAAQALVGETLGRGDSVASRAIARRVAELGGLLGLGFTLVLLGGWTLIPRLFTDDPAVLEQAAVAWPWFALMQPAAGVLFALDGVLMGAGDVAFLRNVTIAAAALGFVPMSLLAATLDLGLGGVWAGLTLFIAIRLVGGVVRTAGGRWAVVGAPT